MTNNLMIETGRIGQPVKYYSTGDSEVAKFQIAVNRKYTKDGQEVKLVSWINIECWIPGLINALKKHSFVGQKVTVHGQHRTDTYDAPCDHCGESVTKYFAKCVIHWLDIQSWKDDKRSTPEPSEEPQPQPEQPELDIPF